VTSQDVSPQVNIWKERKDAESALRNYLSDLPCKFLVTFHKPSDETTQIATVAFVHGPQGSGKSSMVEAAIRSTDRFVVLLIFRYLEAAYIICRKALVIDCAELNKATSDIRLVEALARQCGYRPIFTFLNTVNNMVDIASVGLIGQKGI